MGTGDDVGDVAAVEWKRETTLNAWGEERNMETERLGSGDDTGDLGAGKCRRDWRLKGYGVEKTQEP